MERSIRIGKDFNVRWSIHGVEDGERQPYELAGKELVLQYRTPYGLKEATEWKVVGNTIVWTFRGKEQKALGSYELILTENGGKDGMVTVDTCRAFKLVAHSCEETEGSGSDIVIEDVVLESEVAFAALRGPQGEQGPAGPQGPQGERGPEGPQGPAGPSYNDTEIKGKLAELSEENERLRERIEEQDQFIEDLQNTKIDRENDDYYPKMAVGTADNLAGVDVVDSEINFRRSGGGAISDGVARIESIKGNSVVWNQQYPTDWVQGFSTSANGVISIVGTPTENYIRFSTFNSNVQGHIYLFILEADAVFNGKLFSLLNRAENVTIANGMACIFHTNTDATKQKNIGIKSLTVGEALNATARIRQIDLTQMFNSGNEPTTIEEFNARKPLNIDEYAYNEGEVIHMDVQSIESVGVNQWDEEWEQGGIASASGLPITLAGAIRSKNFSPIFPSTSYYVNWAAYTGDKYIFFYDREQNFISKSSFASNGAVNTPSNAAYFKIRIDQGSSFHKDICINRYDTSINGKYFPYIKRVEDLSIIRKYFPQGMKSAGTAHDEIRYNKASGKRESKDALIAVKMKDLTWGGSILNNYTHAFRAALNVGQASGNNVMCRRFVRLSDSPNSAWLTDSNPYTIAYYYGYIGVNDPAYTDVNAFIASLTDNDILYIERAEPIVTELDEADQFKDLDYQVWNAGTEKAIAEGKSAPLAADITYGFNAIGKIKELESLVAALRAKVGI